VHANDLIVNDGRTRKAIEGIAKGLPHLDREATTALIVKSVDSVDSRALVVATQQEKIFGVLDLVGK